MGNLRPRFISGSGKPDAVLSKHSFQMPHFSGSRSWQASPCRGSPQSQNRSAIWSLPSPSTRISALEAETAVRRFRTRGRHLLVDSALLTEPLISNADGMQSEQRYGCRSRLTSQKCWAWTETPEYSDRCRAVSPMRPRVLASIDCGTQLLQLPRWSSREDIARY